MNEWFVPYVCVCMCVCVCFQGGNTIHAKHDNPTGVY